MKSLNKYIQEGILDNVDDQLTRVNKAVEIKTFIEKLYGLKSRKIEIGRDGVVNLGSNPIGFCLHKNELVVFRGREGIDFKPLSTYKELGIKPNGKIYVHMSAIKAGLKLSDINPSGKNCIIYICHIADGPNGDIDGRALDKFIDINPDPTWSLDITYLDDAEALTSRKLSKFDKVFARLESDKMSIKNCTAKTLCLSNVNGALHPFIHGASMIREYYDVLSKANDGDFLQDRFKKPAEQACATIKQMILDNPGVDFYIAAGAFENSYIRVSVDSNGMLQIDRPIHEFR
jgi:hypothetical protein